MNQLMATLGEGRGFQSGNPPNYFLRGKHVRKTPALIHTAIELIQNKQRQQKKSHPNSFLLWKQEPCGVVKSGYCAPFLDGSPATRRCSGTQRGDQEPWGQEEPAGIAKAFEPRLEGGSSHKDAERP